MSGDCLQKFLISMITLAYFLATFPVSAASIEPISNYNWSGQWNTNYGMMELKQSGDIVEGTCTYKDGRIVAVASGDTLEGNWSHAPSYSPKSDAGSMDFIINDNGNSFNGRWSYGYGENWSGGWSGTRIINSISPTQTSNSSLTEQQNSTATEQSQSKPKKKHHTASVDLYGEKTDVVKGEDIQLKLSAVNLITKPTMHVQVILIPPSGMSVSSSDFSMSGAGQYTSKYILKPGLGRDIEVSIAANQVGNFNVKGKVVYYFGSNKKDAIYKDLNLPIHVSDNVLPSTPLPTSTPTKIPGFGVISLAFMIIIIFLFRRRKL